LEFFTASSAIAAAGDSRPPSSRVSSGRGLEWSAAEKAVTVPTPANSAANRRCRAGVCRRSRYRAEGLRRCWFREWLRDSVFDSWVFVAAYSKCSRSSRSLCRPAARFASLKLRTLRSCTGAPSTKIPSLLRSASSNSRPLTFVRMSMATGGLPNVKTSTLSVARKLSSVMASSGKPNSAKALCRSPRVPPPRRRSAF
jgi:hypothetical protein